MFLIKGVFPILLVPYLRLYFFPWVLPLGLLAEVFVFLVAQWDLDPWRLVLTLLISNVLTFVGSGLLSIALQYLLIIIFGTHFFQPVDKIPEAEYAFAVIFSTLIKLGCWRFSLRYELPYDWERIVILANVLCISGIAGGFEVLPMLGSLKL